MTTTTTRQDLVNKFLSDIQACEFDGEEFEHLKPTASEICAYLDTERCDEIPELDIRLLREKITWARKSFEVKEEFADLEWNQSSWLQGELLGEVIKVDVPIEDGVYTQQGYVAEGFCNTAGCIAGSIAIQHGKPIWELREGYERQYGACFMESGETIEQFAKEKLGLTPVEARLLFDGEASIDFLEIMAEGICLRRGLDY